MHVHSNNSSTQDQLMSSHHIISTTIHLSTVPGQSSNINLTCHMQLIISEVSKFETLLFQQMVHVMSTNIFLTLNKPLYLANVQISLKTEIIFWSIIYLNCMFEIYFDIDIFTFISSNLINIYFLKKKTGV